MPRLDGILETALYFDDLDRAQAFYQDVLGLNRIYSDDRLRGFAIAQGVLLLFARGASSQTMHLPGGTIPPHDGAGPVHVAFAVSAAELPHWEAHLADHDVAIEGRTDWPRGGKSIYFRDPAGHLLELATPGLWANY
jgi:catechol 2,3-dioxygenase-like lactoylglutathione lyase family enzyme